MCPHLPFDTFKFLCSLSSGYGVGKNMFAINSSWQAKKT